ncbi:MAG: hypothetical protein JXQ65_13980 [Candidatus Marinimicrobia bacterium]|nr:hypothetical protein [Candidatus Neomarinimicrobiota bacterium]
MKLNKKPLFFVTILLLVANLFSQSRVNEWKHYTSIINFTDIIDLDNSLYCASSGGIVEYDPETKTFITYGVDHGLSRINLEAIEKDKNGNLWTGSGDPVGEINIFDPVSKTTLEVFDRSVFNEDFSAITDFAFTGERMFAVCQINTDWGLLEFKAGNHYAYKDFYFNFPVSFEMIPSVSIVENEIFIATTTELLSANLIQTDLKNPESWRVIVTAEKISNVVEFNGNRMYGIDNDLFIQGESGPVLFHENMNGIINNLKADSNMLYVSTSKGLYSVNSSGESTELIDCEITQAVECNGKIIGSGADKGIFIKDGTEISQFIPNTLLQNTNTAVLTDQHDNVIAGSKYGFSILSEKGWKNIIRTNGEKAIHSAGEDWNYFVSDSIPFSPNSRIYTLVERQDGFIFGSLYGSSINEQRRGALIKFKPDDLENYALFDTIDGNLASSEGRGGAANFLGVARMKFDKEDNLWICNQYAANDHSIAVLKNDDTWIHFSVPESNYFLDYYPSTVAFDPYGRVWIGDEGAGIAVLDYNGTLNDKTDDEWYKITTNSGLGSNNIYDIEFDHAGILYLLTAGGIQEGEVREEFSGSNYFYRLDVNPKFSNVAFQKENVIKIDGQNNKWFTTSASGVLVYTYDSIWLNNYAGYNIDNSELLSNSVLDIDFIEKEGLVVMSTNKGISILKSQFSETRKDFPELNIFPMPFKLPAHKELVIEGLLPDSEVKIITLDGTFVRHLTEKDGNIFGTQAFWDGRNQAGKLVSSGIYICMAYTEEGKNVAGKIAVIRQN